MGTPFCMIYWTIFLFTLSGKVFHCTDQVYQSSLQIYSGKGNFWAVLIKSNRLVTVQETLMFAMTFSQSLPNYVREKKRKTAFCLHLIERWKPYSLSKSKTFFLILIYIRCFALTLLHSYSSLNKINKPHKY